MACTPAFGHYQYDQNPGGVVWGSDDEVLDFIKVIRGGRRGPDPVGGALRESGEEIERVARLLELT